MDVQNSLGHEIGILFRSEMIFLDGFTTRSSEFA
ncbi:hypothetical protein NMY3_03388 [Candidatus Nitrosocosmicus oleophilus]|uniref:Uncharacterized protein n=1 Tax=Candidatus Nitrosocosmicus oleophilus TaxID=1353260 RepID=A0A654M4M4_9ARCH|nr:hypothetical protein NMY3_03388 [Candidatus Nitrosocosmicus oleophilus]